MNCEKNDKEMEDEILRHVLPLELSDRTPMIMETTPSIFVGSVVNSNSPLQDKLDLNVSKEDLQFYIHSERDTESEPESVPDINYEIGNDGNFLHIHWKSPIIQNELLHIVSDLVLQRVLTDIRKSDILVEEDKFQYV